MLVPDTMRLCNKDALLMACAAALVLLPARQSPAQAVPVQAPSPMVLIPVSVTTPALAMVTGLHEKDFQIYENKRLQKIATFSKGDVPASIGILIDLSGSMSKSLPLIRESVLSFVKASNPMDEFFVIGFSDRPELIENFTSSVGDIEARLVTLSSGHRTALLDAISYGIDKMKDARHERKVLLVVSDGGENKSRTADFEVRAQARRASVEVFALGIFPPNAETPEESLGPQLLSDLSEETGGRLLVANKIDEMPSIAERVSAVLRMQYLIGYRSDNPIRDGKWRKVKVKVDPPPGLPPLTVHARTGYYAPLQ